MTAAAAAAAGDWICCYPKRPSDEGARPTHAAVDGAHGRTGGETRGAERNGTRAATRSSMPVRACDGHASGGVVSGGWAWQRQSRVGRRAGQHFQFPRRRRECAARACMPVPRHRTPRSSGHDSPIDQPLYHLRTVKKQERWIDLGRGRGGWPTRTVREPRRDPERERASEPHSAVVWRAVPHTCQEKMDGPHPSRPAS